jgi:hypothetical protein
MTPTSSTRKMSAVCADRLIPNAAMPQMMATNSAEKIHHGTPILN